MLKAIIADDEPAAALVIQHLIAESGLPIEVAATPKDGISALEEIRRFKPDIVFMDIQMPRMNGLDVISAEPGYKYIIITAYEVFDYAQRALRLGARDILIKPVEYEAFCESVSKVIGWKYTKNSLTNSILEYIEAHYAENIEVNQLAQLNYTTASHIARTFKKNMGTSVIAYLHSVRIKKAVELLDASDMAIKEVALACGYENLNNFYKYFKQIMGMTPAEYRSGEGK